MIEVDQVLKCKQLAGDGWSFRQIARELKLSRVTVRKYVRGEAEPLQYRRTKRHSQRVRDQVRQRVEELLREEQERQTPRKQRLTVPRIHRLLLQQDSFEVSVTTVWRVVKEVRLKMRDPLQHSFLTLDYLPGQDGQVDFFEAVVDSPEGVRSKVFVLLVRACYSARTYCYVAPNQTQEALFEGLIRAFEFFDGVFRCLWFDNLTPAVKQVLQGKHRKLQLRFAAFQAHYGFQAEFCAPGKGNEKGGVEGQVKYTRHEVLTPIPVVSDRSELQGHFDTWMKADVGRTVRGRDQIISDRWQEEALQLGSLPACRFDPARHHTGKVTPRAWIQFGTCYYSVPVEWVGHRLQFKVSAEEVVFFSEHQEVARHARCYGQHQMMLKLEHYLPLLKRKARGLDRALVVRRWLASMPGCWKVLLSSLRSVAGEVAGSRQFVDALTLCERHGAEVVTRAVARTVAHPEVSIELVRYFLGEAEESTAPASPSIQYHGPQVESQTANAFMALCTALEVSHV